MKRPRRSPVRARRGAGDVAGAGDESLFRDQVGVVSDLASTSARCSRDAALHGNISTDCTASLVKCVGRLMCFPDALNHLTT